MKKSVLWMSTGILCNVTGGLFLCSMLKMNQYPDLKLKCEKIEVRQGETVDAGKYVSLCSSKGGRLILPEVHTEENGRYAVVYSLVQDGQSLDRILIVEVKK